VLDEKHVLKRVAQRRVPVSILRRTKQPYRAPDALAFVGAGRVPDYVSELMSEGALARVGLFDPAAAHALFRKCTERAKSDAGGQFSNADNMAFVGVLSAQLLHHALVQHGADVDGNVRWTTRIDRVVG
jgi:asparagine synthase (glutamine-hydrolysing)